MLTVPEWHSGHYVLHTRHSDFSTVDSSLDTAAGYQLHPEKPQKRGESLITETPCDSWESDIQVLNGPALKAGPISF